MKTTILITLAAVLFAGAAVANEFTKGKIKEIKADQEKVTIIHEELKALDMPAMTMVFNVADPAMLEKMQEGADIEFVVERIRGKLTVTEVR